MHTPTRRCSSRPSHLFSVVHVDATLCRWAAARGYGSPEVEMVGDGMPGEILIRVRDEAGVEESLIFALSDGGIHVSDFSVSVWTAAEIDAEVEALWLDVEA